MLCDGKHVTQVLIHRFGDEAATDAIEKAKALAINLAQMFASEDIDKWELIKRRDKMLPCKDSQVAKKPATGSTTRRPTTTTTFANTAASSAAPPPGMENGVFFEDDADDDPRLSVRMPMRTFLSAFSGSP